MTGLPQDAAASERGLLAFARRDAHTHAGIARIFPGEIAFPLLSGRIEHAELRRFLYALRLQLWWRDALAVAAGSAAVGALFGAIALVWPTRQQYLGDGTLVAAATLRGCVVAALRHAHGEQARADDATIERVWLELVSQARLSGALVGAFPTEDEAG